MTPRPPSNGFPVPGPDGLAGDAMPCTHWEEVLVETARSGSSLSDRAQTDAALGHAASCPSCEERLAAERALSVDLNLLAAEDSSLAPTAGCEAVLLAAFRTERGGEVRARRWIFAVAGALAALLVILLGAALVVSRDSGSLARAVFYKLPFASAHKNPPETAAGIGAQATEEEDSIAADDAEEVTDFYAYYPGADLSSVDSGALVRVRVPSSELGAFGLQVAQGREDEWVNADLLVAEDGSPQAIRFVLPAPQETKD